MTRRLLVCRVDSLSKESREGRGGAWRTSKRCNTSAGVGGGRGHSGGRGGGGRGGISGGMGRVCRGQRSGGNGRLSGGDRALALMAARGGREGRRCRSGSATRE